MVYFSLYPRPIFLEYNFQEIVTGRFILLLVPRINEISFLNYLKYALGRWNVFGVC